MTSPDRVAEAVEELYQADLAEFTARRDELAKAARAHGDRASANSIKQLRKPTLSAWVVNLAARFDLPELAELRRTAARLRTAQSDLDKAALKTLSPARQTQERAAVDAAVSLAQQADVTVGNSVVEEIHSTLRALVADPAAEQAVVSGRLTKALSYAGFGEVDITAAVAPGASPLTESPDPAVPAEAEPDAESAASRKQAQSRDQEADIPKEQQSSEEARRRLSAATAAVDKATRRVRPATESRDDAQQVWADAQSEVDRLRAELEDAERRLTGAEQNLHDAELALARSISDSHEAEQRRAAATAKPGGI